MPLRLILENDHAFAPEDIGKLTAAFEAALSKLGLVNRADPMTTAVARAVIQLAKQGVRDPERLCDGAVEMLGRQTDSG